MSRAMPLGSVQIYVLLYVDGLGQFSLLWYRVR